MNSQWAQKLSRVLFAWPLAVISLAFAEAPPVKFVPLGSVSEPISGVTVEGNYAYAFVNSTNLVVLDISDPAHPVEKSRRTLSISRFGRPYPTVLSGTAVRIHGGRIYAQTYYDNGIGQGGYTMYGNALMSADLSNPVEPGGFFSLDNPIQDWYPAFYNRIITGGEYVASVNSYGGPASLFKNGQNTGAFGTSGVIYDTDFFGNYAYTAESTNRESGQIGGIYIYDLNTGHSLTNFDAAGDIRTVKVSGNRLYAGGQNLSVYDLANPVAPFLMGRIPLTGVPVNMQVSGGRVFLVRDKVREGAWHVPVPNRVTAYDVSDPSSIRYLGGFFSPTPLSLQVIDDRLYTCDTTSIPNRFQIYRIDDVATPGFPTIDNLVVTELTESSVTLTAMVNPHGASAIATLHLGEDKKVISPVLDMDVPLDLGGYHGTNPVPVTIKATGLRPWKGYFGALTVANGKGTNTSDTISFVTKIQPIKVDAVPKDGIISMRIHTQPQWGVFYGYFKDAASISAAFGQENYVDPDPSGIITIDLPAGDSHGFWLMSYDTEINATY